jgi:hypothetical protein
MADSEQTRVQETEAAITAVEATYGEENYNRVISVCLKNMAVSLAMLVDAGSTTPTDGEET